MHDFINISINIIADETDPAHFVECKTRRPAATSRGQISWIIEKVDFFTEGNKLS